MSFNFLASKHHRLLPSGFLTIRAGNAQGLLLGLMILAHDLILLVRSAVGLTPDGRVVPGVDLVLYQPIQAWLAWVHGEGGSTIEEDVQNVFYLLGGEGQGLEVLNEGVIRELIGREVIVVGDHGVEGVGGEEA